MYNGVYKLYSALREKEFKKIIEVIITDRSIEFTIERRKCRPYYGERINRIFHKKDEKNFEKHPHFFFFQFKQVKGLFIPDMITLLI